ncbi:MAG: cupin domain-containing protein [Anaerolineales bacterium]|nr:cupin domain-containing protein [Anaerolineales bacterium]
MHLFFREEISEVLQTPTGEKIYELVGKSPGTGGADLHSLALVVIPPGKASSRHYHKIAEESYYLLKGEARMEIAGETIHLRPGQGLLIEPGEVHRISNPGKVDLEFLAVCAPPWQPEDSYEVGKS